MKTRKDCLDELIYGVFHEKYVRDAVRHKTMRLNEAGDVIFEKGMIDQCTFTGSYAERCRKLFRITFFNIDACFMKANDKVVFDRSIALKNIVEYFNSYNIDLSLALCEQDALSKFVFNCIDNHLIPAMFNAEGNKKASQHQSKYSNKKNEDIEKAFIDAMNAIYLEALIFISQYQHNTRMADVMSIEDTEIKKTNTEFNFAIPLNTGMFHSPVVYCWNIPEIEFVLGEIRSLNLSNSLDSANFFEKLTSCYVKIPSDGNEQFIDIREKRTRERINTDTGCILPAEKTSLEILRVPISDTTIPTTLLMPYNFKYLTYLDKELVQRRYPNVRTEEQLDNVLIQKARLDIRRRQESEIRQYYEKVMESIEVILREIIEMDLMIIIHRNIFDIKKCSKMLKTINFDKSKIDKLLSYDAKKEMIIQIYDKIECAIYEYVSQLEQASESLVSEYRIFLNKMSRENHVDSIMSYLNSEKLKLAIQTQDIELQNSQTDIVSTKNEKLIEYRGLHPQLFRWLRDIIKRYCDLIIDKEY